MSSKQIIALPAYTFRIRLAQIVIAVLVLILNIVSTIIFGGYGALSFGIFTPLATCVIIVYWYYANYSNPQYYNRWSILILDCFAVVWWLSLWSALAQWASAIGLIDSIDNAYGVKDLASFDIVHALTAVAAVLGAAEFVLFIVSLYSFSTHLHRTRLSERQNIHPNNNPNPFTNPNYQMNNGSVTGPQPVYPKGGFQASA